MTRRIALAIAAALAALLLSAGLTNAQEPPETATRLEPGLNLVGWVGEPTPVSQLFQQIPRLEAIWAWDAELRDWIVAAPNAPEWLGGLGRVTAGMGLRMQLGGDQPYLWRRSTQPTRGLVKLRTGWNLVAWSGADGAAIGDVVKGIGWSLRTVRRWDATNQQWEVWTSPERSAQVIANTGAAQGDADDEAEPVGIRRGEALWIEVARAVNWLQPTEILPRLVFPGGASQELQTRVREDLQTTLTFFRDQYGIQADPSFTVYIPADVDSLIQAYNDDGRMYNEASTRAQWNLTRGWASDEIVLAKSFWPDDLPADEIAWARYTVTHEYFHVVQRQLADSWASQWLVEGMASWVDSGHAVFDGKQTRDDLRDRLLSAITNDTPTLRSAESNDAGWHYTLGQLATDQLTDAGGPDSFVEFWRALASTEIGPHQRWTSTVDWRTAFQSVFGQPVSEFYAVFDAWQREQAAANPATARPYDGNWIRGRVTEEHGAPVADVFVNAIRVEGEIGVGRIQRAETADDGTFAVRAPEDGDYSLWVDISDDCTRYYSDGHLIDDGEPWNDWQDAQPVKVSQSDVSDINIQLPSNVCGWQIRGRVVGPNAEPLVGISVTACPTFSGSWCHSSASTADGSFAVTAYETGEHSVSANLGDSCSVYFRSGDPTTNWRNASAITVAEAQVSGIMIQAPEDLCHLRVAGFLNGIERFLDGYVSVQLCQLVNNLCESNTSRELEDDGPFTVAAPTSGVYRLIYNLDACSVYHGPTGLAASAADATLINVDSRDVRVGYRQVPTNVCAYEISGALIGADRRPLVDTYVSACLEEDGDCAARIGRRTDDDGVFEITVPTDGRYRLSFSLDGCTVYFGREGLTTTFNERGTARVEGRSVRLSHRQITAEMCAASDTGRAVDSDGAPLSGKLMIVRGPLGSAAAQTDLPTSTDADGSFDILVPSDGVYSFGMQLREQPYCWYNFDRGALGSPGNPVRVDGADAADVVLRPPATIEELCR